MGRMIRSAPYTRGSASALFAKKHHQINILFATNGVTILETDSSLYPVEDCKQSSDDALTEATKWE